MNELGLYAFSHQIKQKNILFHFYHLFIVVVSQPTNNHICSIKQDRLSAYLH